MIIIENMTSKEMMNKDEEFLEYYKYEKKRLNLAMEVYDARKELKLSQSDLAKRVKTTQSVISDIENGNTDVGFELLNRVFEGLKFNSRNLVKIFGCEDVEEMPGNNYCLGKAFNIKDNKSDAKSRLLID